MTQIVMDASGMLTIDTEKGKDLSGEIKRCYPDCEIIQDSHSDWDGKEIRENVITFPTLKELLSGSDYENGAVWTIGSGWSPALN